MDDFGAYRIVRRMASGGMAEIFLARQRAIEGVERTVVIKQILPNHSRNPEFVTMFLDEARLMASLSHPNIVQVLDLGKREDVYYLVMEYVRGPTLGAMLAAAAKRGKPGLPMVEGVTIGIGVAEALHYVHSCQDSRGRPLNVVHRDLNPANVLLAYTGGIKLIDFGIAKAATKVYETRTGVIKGTYGYIAPEQLAGTAPVDHRADVFSLGVLLYEMLVGEHPFDTSDEPNFIDRLLNAKYKRPRQVQRDFPKELDKLITRCLAAHPDGRPADVAEVMSGLIHYLRTERAYCAMSQLATLVGDLVPDEEGPTRFKPVRATQMKRPFGEEASSITGDDDGLGTEAGSRSNRPGLDAVLDSGDEMTMNIGSERLHEDDGLQSEPSETMLAPQPEELLRHGRPASMSSLPPASLSKAPPAALKAPRPSVGPGSGLRGVVRRKMFIPLGIAAVALSGAAAFFAAQGLKSSHGDVVEAQSDPEFNRAGATADDDAAREPTVVPLAELRVVTEPEGASIAVDGQALEGTTPTTTVVDGAARSVFVQVKLKGYVSQEREVRTNAGEARFVLTPLPDAPAQEKRRRRRPSRR